MISILCIFKYLFALNFILSVSVVDVIFVHLYCCEEEVRTLGAEEFFFCYCRLYYLPYKYKIFKVGRYIISYNYRQIQKS